MGKLKNARNFGVFVTNAQLRQSIRKR